MKRAALRGPVARDDEAARGRAVVVARRACQGAACGGAPVTHTYATLVFCEAGRSRVELDGAWNLREAPLDRLCVPRRRAADPLELGQESAQVVAAGDRDLGDRRRAVPDPLERLQERRGADPRERGRAEGQGPAVRSPLGGPVGRASGHEEHVTLLTLVLAEVERATSAGSGQARGGVVGAALRFIERRCLGPLSLGEVAAAVGRSPAHVTTALRKATGRSAGQWIVSGRLAEARALLLHTDERVDVVAARVGYADATHFIRMFRREHGATPAAWRAARRSPEARRA